MRGFGEGQMAPTGKEGREEDAWRSMKTSKRGDGRKLKRNKRKGGDAGWWRCERKFKQRNGRGRYEHMAIENRKTQSKKKSG